MRKQRERRKQGKEGMLVKLQIRERWEKKNENFFNRKYRE